MIHHAREHDHSYENVKNIVREFMKAFPDLNFQIEDIVAEGDRVVTRMTAHATHMGDYMGLSRTGKTINCTVLGIARLANGKIAEHWGVTDSAHSALASQVPRANELGKIRDMARSFPAVGRNAGSSRCPMNTTGSHQPCPRAEEV